MGKQDPKRPFHFLSSSGFLASYSFVKSLSQAAVTPFALLHLFYCSFFFTLFPLFVLCIHFSSSPIFFYSFHSLDFLFSCLPSKCSPNCLYFFFFLLISIFLPLGSLLHFLILVKHGWLVWTCWWLLFRSGNQLREQQRLLVPGCQSSKTSF